MSLKTMSIKKKLMAAGAAVLLGIAGGIAYAQWTGEATGSGSAKSLTVEALTVVPCAADNTTDCTPDLYPGGPAGTVYFQVNNPNPFAIHFDTYTVGTLSTAPTACPASANLTVESASGSLAGGGFTAAANSTTTMQHIDAVVSMNATAGNDCFDQSFDIPLTLSGTQV